MPKRIHRKNIHEPGHIHELTFSCYHNYSLLKSEHICSLVCDSIIKARHKHKFLLWAYVLMPDHVHLLVLPDRSKNDISKIRQSIKGPSARKSIDYIATKAPDWLPKLTRLRGGVVERLLWQSGGGYDRNIIKPSTLMSSIDYIHANPIRRNLVTDPCDWKWSSASWYIKGESGPISIDPIPPEWLHT